MAMRTAPMATTTELAGPGPNEALGPFAGIDFGGVHTALGVHSDVVYPMEFTGLLPGQAAAAATFDAGQIPTRLHQRKTGLLEQVAHRGGLLPAVLEQQPSPWFES